MAENKDLKRKVTTSQETGYPLYEDGRFTYLMSIEDEHSRRGVLNGKELIISHNKGYSTCMGPFNLKDLKALRKLIRKAIRHYEDNKPLQI